MSVFVREITVSFVYVSISVNCCQKLLCTCIPVCALCVCVGVCVSLGALQWLHDDVGG